MEHHPVGDDLKNNMNNLIYWFLDYFFILLIFDLHCSFDNFSIPSIIWSTIVAISFYLTIIYFSNTTISFWIGTIIVFIGIGLVVTDYE